MANINLRAYIEEIDHLIDKGQHEEATAHCRYLLEKYPKLIAAYRLLGKVFLETQQYSDAADVLQRVLSSTPDDFVSHVGMSIIRQDQGDLDGAIWHLERAFDVQPANLAIQDELRGLYGRREGKDPGKIYLTRGALARMYAKGNLHAQAVAELLAALAEDPERMDLQFLLAREYMKNGQKVQAAEALGEILQKLPYCYEANKLMAELLMGTERSTESDEYFKRVQAMDPYASLLDSPKGSPADISDSAVTLEKFEWSPASIEPEWSSEIESSPEEQLEPGQIPDWLAQLANNDELPASAAPRDADQPELNDLDPSGEEAAAIPDWMQAAGWAAAGESAVSDAETPSGDDLEAADIPDWLRAIAPALSEKPPVETQEMDAMAISSEDVAPIDGPEISSEPDLSAEEEMADEQRIDVPDWLSSLQLQSTENMQPASSPQEVGDHEVTPSPEPFSLPEDAEPQIPDWLKNLDEAGSDPEVDLEAAPLTPTVTDAEEMDELAPADLPDWLKALNSASTEDVAQETSGEWVPAEASAELDRVETGMEFAEETTGEVEAGTEAGEWVPAEASPELDVPEAVSETADLPSQETEEADPPAGEDGADLPSPAEEVEAPAWLGQETQPSELPMVAEQTHGDIPDWLKGLGEELDAETAGAPAATWPEEPPILEGDTQPSALTLQMRAGLAAQEEPTSSPEAGTLEPTQDEASSEDTSTGWLAAFTEAEPNQADSSPELDEFTTNDSEPEAPPADLTDAHWESLQANEAELPVSPEEEIEPVHAGLPEEVAETLEQMESDSAGEAVVDLPEWHLEAPEGAITARLEESLSQEEPAESGEDLPEWLREATIDAALQREELLGVTADFPSPPPAEEVSDMEAGLPQEEQTPDPVQETSEWTSGFALLKEEMDEVEQAAPPPFEPPAENEPGDATEHVDDSPEWLPEPFVETSTDEMAQAPAEVEPLPAWPSEPAHESDSEPVMGWMNSEGADSTPQASAANAEPERLAEPTHLEQEPTASTPADPLLAARALLTSGDLPAATSAYTALIRQEVSLPEVIQDLNNAVQSYPSDPNLYETLGDAYMRNNQLNEALDAYNKAEEFLA